MFPISHNQPYMEGGVPDTRFEVNSGTITAGHFNGKRYFVCAAGKPIHGLNVNNTLVNRIDFGTPLTFGDFQFVSDVELPGQTEQRWNGTTWNTYAKRSVVTQISGFRSGDVNLIKVPGFNPKRLPNALDTAQNLRWKSYALVSGAARYTFGYALGAKTWICTFGVGRSYSVKLMGSSAGPNASRKFTFFIQPFSIIGEKVPGYTEVHDTGIKDHLASTGTDILTNAIPNNLRGLERWRVEDYTKTGQKSLVSAYFAGEGKEAYENDGVNDATTSPVSWLEFTFTEAGDKLAIAHRVVKNYSTSTSDGVNLVRTFVPTYASFRGKLNTGDMRYIAQISQKTTEHPGGGAGSMFRSNEFGWMAYEQTSDDQTHPVFVPVIEGFGPDSGLPSTYLPITPRVGFAAETADTAYGFERVVHMCYDKDDTISSVRVRFTKYRANIAEMKSISHSGSAWSQLYMASPADPSGHTESGGVLTVTLEQELCRLSGTYFELFDGSKLIGHLRSELKESVRTDISTMEWHPDAAGGYTAGPASTTTTGDRYVSEPAFAKGNLYAPFGVEYQTLGGARMTTSYFRDGGYTVDQVGGKIWPCVRVESNKLVSFNIGVGGGGVQQEEQGSGDNGQYPITYPVLTPGKHKYRWVYDMYNHRLLVNTDLTFGTMDNPAVEIDTTYYQCTLNPATGEAVLNANTPCVYS